MTEEIVLHVSTYELKLLEEAAEGLGLPLAQFIIVSSLAASRRFGEEPTG